MTDLLGNTESPVSVTITTDKSSAFGRCTSGKECLRTQVRTKSAEERNRRSLNSRTGFSGNHFLSPGGSGFRSRSYERQGSGRRNQQRSVLLDIPSITVNEVSTVSAVDRDDYSDLNMNTYRSRSPSPFDWIARERLPCGSPAFEKVMCDMLTKISDTELSGDANADIKKNTSKRTSTFTQKKSCRNSRKNKARV